MSVFVTVFVTETATPPPAPESPRETLTFIDPAGVETPFTTDTITALWGISGRFMPPVDFVEEATPGQAGARLRNVRVKPREVAIPLFIQGATAVELRTIVRDLARRLYPTRGDGRLRNVAADGSTRELVCRYSTGYELTESREMGGRTWQKTVIAFRAADDPFWHDVDPIELTFATGTPPAFFPIFPISLARSTVFGGVTIHNPGDVETWPVWTIVGPGTGLVLTNTTTGESIGMSTVLTAGHYITIDTTPGVKTVTLDGTTNLFPDLTAGYSLFPLEPGDNAISVTLSGTTSASEITLAYRARYLTP